MFPGATEAHALPFATTNYETHRRSARPVHLSRRPLNLAQGRRPARPHARPDDLAPRFERPRRCQPARLEETEISGGGAGSRHMIDLRAPWRLPPAGERNVESTEADLPAKGA